MGEVRFDLRGTTLAHIETRDLQIRCRNRQRPERSAAAALAVRLGFVARVDLPLSILWY